MVVVGCGAVCRPSPLLVGAALEAECRKHFERVQKEQASGATLCPKFTL